MSINIQLLQTIYNKLILNTFRRLVRFRWYQKVDASQPPVQWAIDAVYVGPRCPDDCGGHGSCVKRSGSRHQCVCDKNYQGSYFICKNIIFYFTYKVQWSVIIFRKLQ